MSDSFRHDNLDKTYLFGRYWTLASLSQLFNDTAVSTEILLATDKDYGKTWAEVHDFRDPLECECQ